MKDHCSYIPAPECGIPGVKGLRELAGLLLAVRQRGLCRDRGGVRDEDTISRRPLRKLKEHTLK